MAKHKFDVALWNGALKLLGLWNSFEGLTDDRFISSVRAGTYHFEDIRKARPGLVLAVIVLEPEDENEAYNENTGIFEDQRVRVVTEAKIDLWAEEVAAKFAHV